MLIRERHTRYEVNYQLLKVYTKSIRVILKLVI